MINKTDLKKLDFNKLSRDLVEVIYECLLEDNPYTLGISNVYEKPNTNIINSLVSIFSEDIYTTMYKTINDPNVITYLREKNTDGSQYTFDINDFFKVVYEEYIKLAPEFKQNKGLDIAIEYAYQMIYFSGIQNFASNIDVPFEITWGTDENPNQPFVFQAQGLLLPFLYNNVVKGMAHPVGFGYEYRRNLSIKFQEYVNDDVVDVFTKITVSGLNEVYDFTRFVNSVTYYNKETYQDGTYKETIKFINNGEIQVLERATDGTITLSKDDTGEILNTWNSNYQLTIEKTQEEKFIPKDAMTFTIKLTPYDIFSPNKKSPKKIGEPNLIIGSNPIWTIDSPHIIPSIPEEIDYNAFTKFYLSNTNMPKQLDLVIDIDKQTFISNTVYGNSNFKYFANGVERGTYARYILTEANCGFSKWNMDGTNNVLYIPKSEVNNFYFTLLQGKTIPSTSSFSIYLSIDDRNHTSYSGTQRLMMLNDSKWITLSYDTANQYYILNIAGVGSINSSRNQFPLNNTKKFCITYEAKTKTISFYINGNLIGTKSISSSQGVSKIIFNTNDSLSQGTADIKFVNFRVFNRIALTSTEINDINKYDTNFKTYPLSDYYKYLNDASIRGLYRGVGETFSIDKIVVRFVPKTKEELIEILPSVKGNLGRIDPSLITDMSGVFQNFKNWKNEDFNGIEKWKTPNLTNIDYIFEGCTNFNQDISSWDVSNVTTAKGAFKGCTSYNKPLSSWDTRSLEYIDEMFRDAKSFNQNIDNWNVGRVKDTTYFSKAFDNCPTKPIWYIVAPPNRDEFIKALYVEKVPVKDMMARFKLCPEDMSFMFDNYNLILPSQDYVITDFSGIETWNVLSVTNMDHLFYEARTFNQDISSWNVSNVTNMSSAFGYAIAFNQDISSWNVSNVTNMYAMFFEARTFNQDISSWNVSNVTNMYYMFGKTNYFNQDISSWNVSNVTDMSRMFNEASAFNQNLEDWGKYISGRVVKMTDMFLSCPAPIPSWYTGRMAQVYDTSSRLGFDFDNETQSTQALIWNLAGIEQFYLNEINNKERTSYNIESLLVFNPIVKSNSQLIKLQLSEIPKEYIEDIVERLEAITTEDVTNIEYDFNTNILSFTFTPKEYEDINTPIKEN